jgi:hypothetical protein
MHNVSDVRQTEIHAHSDQTWMKSRHGGEKSVTRSFVICTLHHV